MIVTSESLTREDNSTPPAQSVKDVMGTAETNLTSPHYLVTIDSEGMVKTGQ